MSSHREAPEIAKDPVADNTDTYAFISPDRPDTVTLITNYIPLEYPAGGPNFFEFGDDVLYRINVDNDGDGEANVIYEFRFTTQTRNPQSFLYNTGQITNIGDDAFNRPQSYSVVRRQRQRRRRERLRTLADGLVCPPCNIGPRSTPDYPRLAGQAVYDLDGGGRVFAGQRLEGFYVDLGSVFDLLDLRPFENLHLFKGMPTAGVDSTRAFNVHTIAIQVPITDLTPDGSCPRDPMDPGSTIGVWGSASRQKARVRDRDDDVRTGPWVQVSRLGNPLFNEVVVPLGLKDRWNRVPPSADAEFLRYVQRPELTRLLPALYPGVFPNLAALDADRADLVAILLTGIPAGVVPGFQNFTGATYADQLRLNVAVPPTTANPNPLGLVAGDPAGFPNGRRVFDDVFTVELRAVAGLTYPLIDPSFMPDSAVNVVTDGVQRDPATSYLPVFPYLHHPVSGYDVVPPALAP